MSIWLVPPLPAPCKRLSAGVKPHVKWASRSPERTSCIGPRSQTELVNEVLEQLGRPRPQRALDTEPRADIGPCWGQSPWPAFKLSGCSRLRSNDTSSFPMPLGQQRHRPSCLCSFPEGSGTAGGLEGCGIISSLLTLTAAGPSQEPWDPPILHPLPPLLSSS